MRVLFLVQSCNQERYLNEEQIIRETWAKRLRKDCDIFYYRGEGDDTLEGDVLLLNCKDDLNSTFLKTVRALYVFKNKDYDFVVRTNTSNWVNVDLLLDTLETLDPNKRELYGCKVVSNVGSQGIPFLRGNLLVFNRCVLKDLFDSLELKPLYTGVDDVGITFNLFKLYQTMGVDYFTVLRTLESDSYKEKFNFKKLNKIICLRCLEEIKKRESSDILKEIDEKYLNNRIIVPKEVNCVETVLGEIFIKK